MNCNVSSKTHFLLTFPVIQHGYATCVISELSICRVCDYKQSDGINQQKWIFHLTLYGYYIHCTTNKGPKGPHIVHLKTMCHFCWQIGQDDHPSWPEKHKLGRRPLCFCFLSSFVKFISAVTEEMSKMSQPIKGKGGHLGFPIGPK